MPIKHTSPFLNYTFSKNSPSRLTQGNFFASTTSVIQFFSKRMIVLYAVIAFFFLSLLFLTWIRISQLQSGYALAKLESKELALREQARALELEIAVLKRPERIRRIAMQKLNLTMPTARQIVRPHQLLDP